MEHPRKEGRRRVFFLARGMRSRRSSLGWGLQPSCAALRPGEDWGLAAGQGAQPPLPSPTRHSGILSAYGLALADVVQEAQEPCSLTYGPQSYTQLDERVAALEQKCVKALEAQGFSRYCCPLGQQRVG